MGSPKNTITNSKRRKAGDSARRFSTRSRKKGDDGLPLTNGPSPPKARPVNCALKLVAVCAIVVASGILAKTWQQRILRRQQLMEDLDSDRLLPGDADKADMGSLLEELNKKSITKSNEDEEEQLPNGKNEDGANEDSVSTEESDSTGSRNDGHHSETQDGSSLQSHNDVQEMREELRHEHPVSTTSNEDNNNGRNEGEEEVIIKEFPSAIEWYTRDDMKAGQRPICRISRPCMLSNGMIALPMWMQGSEELLRRCGLGNQIYYKSLTSLPGARHVRMLGVDFALTIRPERFQEPTHALNIFLNEHLLKSSFLFDTFSGKTHTTSSLRVTHCIATKAGNDCSIRTNQNQKFRPGIFVPSKMRQSGKTHSFGLRLIHYFGRGYSEDRTVTHLNLSTILTKSHRDQNEGLSATCFRSILSVDAMFRHLPPQSLMKTSLLSKKNSITRSNRKRIIPGAGKGCQLNIGIIDLSEGPRGIINVLELKQTIEQIGRLAIPGGIIIVELIRIENETTLEEHVRQIQNLDVFISGSGDEMSSSMFLRNGSQMFEILQFGMIPDTYRSLASALGISYFSLQAKPSSDIFKNCLETQVLNLRKKGILGDGENPRWWDPLMSTWDNAAAEFTLNGKTDFDILANQTNIANFDSRHCAKMQTLGLNYEEAARSIMLQAKSLCDSD